MNTFLDDAPNNFILTTRQLCVKFWAVIRRIGLFKTASPRVLENLPKLRTAPSQVWPKDMGTHGAFSLAIMRV